MGSLITRRNFLRGLVAAPAIVQIGSIMPVKALPLPLVDPVVGFKISERYLVLPPRMFADLMSGYAEQGAALLESNPLIHGCLGTFLGLQLIEAPELIDVTPIRASEAYAGAG